MAPRPGSIHRVARSDSKAALMWSWAQIQRTPWSTLDLAEHIGGSPRRIRETVSAWLAADLVRRIKPAKQAKRAVLTYEIAWEHRGKPAPVAIVAAGRIVGLRMAELVDPARIEAIRERAGISATALAARLGINASTLSRILAGEIRIATNDPIIAQLNVLDAIAGA